MYQELQGGSGGSGGNSAAGTFTTTVTSSNIHIPLDFKPNYVWYRKTSISYGREVLYNEKYSTTAYRYKAVHQASASAWQENTIATETSTRGGFVSCDDAGGFTIRGTESGYDGEYYFFACDNAPTEATVTPT